MSEASARVTIVNMRGLHARAAAKICETASAFQSRIEVSKDGTAVGARSLMALLMLGAGKGSKVTLRAEGPDAEEAVKAVRELIEAGFHEEE
ncbi:HPr family phosphocarrier protein [Parvularcula maris]|uniref:HPr family phosphocarrier protein n=1 Tax=Parvularcula maris TaxID=2965077 RepID=A0A9X2LAQ9_9PROT|nr:HPr family phosphocarrier protein [Parvularcula maris]